MEVTLERYLLAVIPSKKYFTLLKQFREAPADPRLETVQKLQKSSCLTQTHVVSTEAKRRDPRISP